MNNIKSPPQQLSPLNKNYLNEDILSDFNDRPLQYFNSKIRNFRRCFNLLSKLFLNAPVENCDLSLNEMEKMLFLYICRRKYPSLSIPISKDQPLEDEFFESLVQKCKNELSNKRIEENIKFIFKHSMKYLKERFKSLSFPLNSDESSLDFYHYYFKEVAEATGMSYDAFQDPLNCKNKKSSQMPKTLNNEYLQLLFRSRPFLRDFKSYIANNHMIGDYMKTIPKKFEKLLLKWERISDGKIDKKIFKEKLNEYFFKNKQCKLPWTVNEIISAVSYFLNMMKSFQGSKD